MDFEVKCPIYLYNVGKGFPMVGNPLDANLTAQVKELEDQSVFYYPVCVSREGSTLEVSSYCLVVSHNSLVSLSLSLSH